MPAWLIVFLGAGIGGLLRHLVNQATAQWFGADFPWGTLTVNIVGSLVMGLIAGYFASWSAGSPAWRLFLATGILGGFTTFSSFSLDIVVLFGRGEAMAATLYVAASLVFSIAGLWAGLWLIRTAT